MNTRFFTGYLPGEAVTAWAPATAEHGPLPRVLFEVRIKDSVGVEFEDKCMIDDARLIADCLALLTAGRAVIVQGEQTARPFHKNGVLTGWVREVRVQRMEFPNRKAAALPVAGRANEKAGAAEVEAEKT